MNVEVSGADDVAAAFERLARDAAGIDVSAAGDLGVEQLQRTSPRLTGKLAESWDVLAEPGRVNISSPLVYGAVQNFGGYHGITGLHFVERAAEVVTDEAGRIYSDELDQLIARM